jgi:hypothetical protein
MTILTLKLKEVLMKKTALITGAGGGIGRELCRVFHAEGYDIAAVSLVDSELASLKHELEEGTGGGNVSLLAIDLSEPDAAERVMAWCDSSDMEIEVLVNNVGIVLMGEHVVHPLDHTTKVMSVNMITLTGLCHLFGARMKQRGYGRILNVASTVSYQPLPYLAVYAGTKAYVSSFTQALATELEPHGVTVSCLYPGLTRTEFLTSAGVPAPTSKNIMGSAIHGFAMDPAKVAREGFRGVHRGARRSIPGIVNKFHFVAIHWIPNRVIVRAVHAVLSRFDKKYHHPPTRGQNMEQTPVLSALKNPVMLYDGPCVFCNGAVKFILQHDKKKVILFTSLQSEDGQTLLRHFGLPDKNFNSFVVIHNNRAYRRFEAVLQLGYEMGGYWPTLTRIADFLIPNPIGNTVYRILWPLRKVFGTSEQCMMPTSEMHARMMNMQT